MTCLDATVRLGARALLRNPAVLATWAAAALLTLIAPRLVAFAFGDARALAIEGALGTATVAGPMIALFGALAFSSEDDDHRTLRPLLLASCPPATGFAGLVAGLGLAASAITGSLAALALVTLAAHEVELSTLQALLPVFAAALSCLPAAALGLLLATTAPRLLASALATLAVLLGFFLPVYAPPAVAPFVPSSDTMLLSRDLAHGGLEPVAALSSAFTSLLWAAAAVALLVLALRLRGHAPDPGIHSAPPRTSS